MHRTRRYLSYRASDFFLAVPVASALILLYVVTSVIAWGAYTPLETALKSNEVFFAVKLSLATSVPTAAAALAAGILIAYLSSRVRTKDAAQFLGLNALEDVVRSTDNTYVRVYSEELGGEVMTRAADGIKEGSRVLITFRPDDVVILGSSALPDNLNVVNAIVVSMQVTKCNVKLLLRLPGSTVIKAEVSRGYIINALNELSPGSEVRVGIPLKSMHISQLSTR